MLDRLHLRRELAYTDQKEKGHLQVLNNMITALLFNNDSKVELSHINTALSKLLIDSKKINNQAKKEKYKEECTELKNCGKH
ncbi:MAG: hypothetical protein K2X94_02690 [Amoebophilaceae bacterium]|nr:hypothetical protein [Amoebophilaceae bacterium]